MLLTRITLAGSLCLFVFISYALDLTRVNLSYQYDVNGLMTMKHRVVSEEDNRHVYIDVKSDSLRDWTMVLLIQDKYNSERHDTLSNFSHETLLATSDRSLIKLGVEYSEQKPLLLVTFVHLEKGLYRIYDINLGANYPSFLPLDTNDLPILTNYLVSQPVQIAEGSRFHAYEYVDDFPQADPPMGTMKPIAPSLEIDSSFYFSDTLGGLSDFHFYLFQRDTLDQSALTLLKCPPYFPRQRKLEELVLPLIYITTPTEMKTIRGMMTKKAFENFWINTYGTKFRAKSAIRTFYDRVEQANELFTDYKQGWKTDRGMLYIVYGRPAKVEREERSEVWLYQDGTEFEFIRISTLFTPNMYSLRRDRKYENLWYSQVGDIRKDL